MGLRRGQARNSAAGAEFPSLGDRAGDERDIAGAAGEDRFQVEAAAGGSRNGAWRLQQTSRAISRQAMIGLKVISAGDIASMYVRRARRPAPARRSGCWPGVSAFLDLPGRVGGRSVMVPARPETC